MVAGQGELESEEGEELEAVEDAEGGGEDDGAASESDEVQCSDSEAS